MIWKVTFATEGRGLRTFRIAARSPTEAEERARLQLTLEAVDAEMVSVERIEEPT